MEDSIHLSLGVLLLFTQTAEMDQNAESICGEKEKMSLSGNIAMVLLRLIKPGKGSFSNLEKLKKKAKKENEGFEFSMPKSRKAVFSLLPGMEKECLIIRPTELKDPGKAVLYIYGGVTNNWKTQRSMAVRYAVDTGVQVWYPVYPSMTEVCMTDTILYLTDIYRRMTEHFASERIVLTGVSMGGFYALQIVNAINQLELDLPMPGLILAHSAGGSADNEKDWELFRQYEKRDPMFAESDLRMVERITPHTEPIPGWVLYPAQGDFTNAPPTYLYYGEEMVAGNASLYKRAYDRSGTGDRLHIEIVKNMMHGYSCMPVFPESRRSYNETLKLIEEVSCCLD